MPCGPRLALGWDPEEALTRAKHERPTLTFTHHGRTLALRGWAYQSGIKYPTLYRRITVQGLSFEQALDKGPDGENYMVPVTAFGETKPLHRWGVDPRANVSVSTIRKRIKAGWNPQLAITETPENRNTLGTGHPHTAFGRRMSIPEWSRLSTIPDSMIRYRMKQHGLTLEGALQSLGWTPTSPALTTSVLTVTLDACIPATWWSQPTPPPAPSPSAAPTPTPRSHRVRHHRRRAPHFRHRPLRQRANPPAADAALVHRPCMPSAAPRRTSAAAPHPLEGSAHLPRASR